MRRNRIISALLATVLMFTFCFSMTAFAADTGWISASGNNDNHGVSDPADAYSSGNGHASFDRPIMGQNYDDYVDYTFGNNIVPANSVILGIQVNIEARETALLSSSETVTISLYNNTSLKGTKTVNVNDNDDAFFTLGGSADTWGYAWTAAEINSTTTFQVRVSADNVDLDHIQVKFYYVDNSDVTINYVSNDSEMGTVSSSIETVAAYTGTASGSTATANPGYHFEYWEDGNGTPVTSDFTLIPEKVDGVYVAGTYTAVFEIDDVNTVYAELGDATVITGSDFPGDIELIIEDITGEVGNWSLYQGASFAVSESSLLRIFNIELLWNDEPYEFPEGQIVEIRIRIPAELLANYTNLQLVYFEEGEGGPIAHLVDAVIVNGYFVFTTDHLSEYGIIGDEKPEYYYGSYGGYTPSKDANPLLPPGEDDEESEPVDDANPNTGLAQQEIPYGFIAVFGIACAAGVVLYNRKKAENK